jgi:hypothetical protein
MELNLAATGGAGRKRLDWHCDEAEAEIRFPAGTRGHGYTLDGSLSSAALRVLAESKGTIAFVILPYCTRLTILRRG